MLLCILDSETKAYKKTKESREEFKRRTQEQKRRWKKGRHFRTVGYEPNRKQTGAVKIQPVT
jgi:hypothetical protein